MRERKFCCVYEVNERSCLCMKYERLQHLGDEKFRKIVNELARRTPIVMVARLIQQEWRDFQNVAEDTLAKQLKRLQTDIINGAFGGDLAEQARRKASVGIKLFHGSTLDCLDELVELAMIQKTRIHVLWEKEQELNLCLSNLNTVINDYRELLLSIQKIKFDLGLDEYKGVIPGVKAMATSVTRPDVEKQVMEAIEDVEDIFRRRGIYLPSNADAQATDD
jgi:hypothetical protein